MTRNINVPVRNSFGSRIGTETIGTETKGRRIAMGKYSEKTNEIMAFFGELAKANPEIANGFMSMHKFVEKDSALTVKEKEFIALGIAIGVRCEGCISAHVGNLVELGVTKEEIMEVISVAVMLGGGPSVTYGAVASQAFKELSAG